MVAMKSNIRKPCRVLHWLGFDSSTLDLKIFERFSSENHHPVTIPVCFSPTINNLPLKICPNGKFSLLTVQWSMSCSSMSIEPKMCKEKIL